MDIDLHGAYEHGSKVPREKRKKYKTNADLGGKMFEGISMIYLDLGLLDPEAS